MFYFSDAVSSISALTVLTGLWWGGWGDPFALRQGGVGTPTLTSTEQHLVLILSFSPSLPPQPIWNSPCLFPATGKDALPLATFSFKPMEHK